MLIFALIPLIIIRFGKSLLPIRPIAHFHILYIITRHITHVTNLVLYCDRITIISLTRNVIVGVPVEHIDYRS